MNIVRTLGIFMALAALSFVLGFFVLARLIPSSSKSGMAASVPMDSSRQTAEPRELVAAGDTAAAPAVQPKRRIIVASNNAPAAQRKAIATPGPSLDPINEPPPASASSGVQQPRKVQESTTRDTASPSNDGRGSSTAVDGADGSGGRSAAPAVRLRHRRHVAAPKTDAPLAASSTANGDASYDGTVADSQDTPIRKTRRPRRVTSDDNSIADSQEPLVRKSRQTRRVTSNDYSAADNQDPPIRKSRHARRVTAESGDAAARVEPPIKKRTRRTRGAANAESYSANSQETAAPKAHRPRRVMVASADGQDDAATDQGYAERTARRRTVDGSAPTAGLFHVHLGAFHSREAANNEVQRAKVKGFATRVVPVTHNGRTLYRVQAGAYRERMRAESVKQSLQDASIDASVTEQHR